MTDTESHDRLVARHYELEIAGDIEPLVHTLTDDVVRRGAGSRVVQGRDAARAEYQALFSWMLLDEIVPIHRWHGPDLLVDRSLFKATAVGDPWGLPGRGRAFEFEMLHVFEFRDGLISREDGWVDFRAVLDQLDDDDGGEEGDDH